MTTAGTQVRHAASPEERLTIPQDRSFLPWTSDNLARLLLLNAGALALMIASWYLISGSTSLRQQMAWLKMSMFGLALSGVANGLWLMAGRHAVGLARVQVLGRLQTAYAAEDAGREFAHDTPEASRVDVVYLGPRMTRFHRDGCPLAQGRRLTAMSRSDVVIRGHQPCELCEP
jgi:hypothetical protein